MRIGHSDVWTFGFKSITQYYWKEKKDIKNNTVREIDIYDERFVKLLLLAEEGWNDGEARIRITCAENQEESFVRDIRDISVFGELVIITWHPKRTRTELSKEQKEFLVDLNVFPHFKNLGSEQMNDLRGYIEFDRMSMEQLFNLEREVLDQIEKRFC